MKQSLFAIVIALFVTTPTWAWDETGHRVTAAIAWDTMSSAARDQATRILQAHPQYESHLLRDLPEGYDADKWVFTSAAVWPDMIRDRADALHHWHHGPWHYVNYPVNFDGDTRGFPEPDPAPPAQGEPQNVLQVIPLAFATVVEPRSLEQTRAIALCWWLHCVGDLHQPLHASAWVSDTFPEGDRGGNLTMIELDGEPRNLHSVWDGWLGDLVPDENGDEAADLGAALDALTRQITTQHPVSSVTTAPADPVTIALESRELARSHVYLGGELPFAVRDSGDPAPAPPADYAAASRARAEHRSAQAGYRIGAALNDAFGTKK